MATKQRPMIFSDRAEAGRLLAGRLCEHVDAGVVVLGVARGGVPVASEVARLLEAPADVVVTSRLGIPRRPEVAMGAVAEGGVRVVDEQIIDAALVSPHDLDVVERHERLHLVERVEQLRAVRAPLMLGGRTALVIDDGIVTGVSARAAARVARARGAERVVVAVPIASHRGLNAVLTEVDEVVTLQTRKELLGVGQAYLDFDPVDDVHEWMSHRSPAHAGPRRDEPDAATTAALAPKDIVVPVGSSHLYGRLTAPASTSHLVIMGHDSCRERFCARSRFVGGRLLSAGFATLLLDLLTRDEERYGERFLAIDRLAERLCEVRRRVAEPFDRVSYLGHGVAGALVLEAAAREPGSIHAVACLAGRPELTPRLGATRSPVLFLVGQRDHAGLHRAQVAAARLKGTGAVVIVPGAGQSFREPGTLRQASEHLCHWLAHPFESIRAREESRDGPGASRR